MNQWLIVYPSAQAAIAERLQLLPLKTRLGKRVGVGLLEDVIRTGIDKESNPCQEFGEIDAASDLGVHQRKSFDTRVDRS